MAVTIGRKPFSKVERDVVAEAVMTGQCPAELPELDAVAMEIAERLPELLKHARLPDTSENRRAVIEFVLARWGLPKHQPSRSYRQFR